MMITKRKLVSHLWQNRSARAGLLIITIVFICSIFSPLLAPYDPHDQNMELLSKPPSLSHPLGTDFFGRDLLSRLIFGARVSLGVSLSAAIIAVVFGMTVGVISGFLGGWVDQVLMRIVDVLLGFPRIFIILLAIGFGRPSVWLMIMVLGFLSWMEIARIVRGEVLIIREMAYLKSAIALGLSQSRIIWRYILPNISGPIIVSATLLMGTMIIIEASLSFLGLGVQPPMASWGAILNQGRLDPLGAWWISTFAGLAIVITVVGINLAGDGLRDMLDPKSYLPKP